MNEIKTLVGIRFLDKYGALSSKTYRFLMNTEMYLNNRESFMTKSFRLVNSNGYDYRNSIVVMTDAEFKAEDLNYTGITKVSFTDVKNEQAIPDKYATSQDYARLLWSEADKTWEVSPKEESSNFYINEIPVQNISISTDSNTKLNWGAGGGGSGYIYTDKIAESMNNIQDISDKIHSCVERIANLESNVSSAKNDNLTDKNNEKEKENKMNKFGLNVKFGKVSSNEIKMSMYGPAFRSQDGWFAFDGENYIDVENFLFDGENYCYMMPVTEAALELNDYIYHVDGWCRIVQVDEIGRLEVERIKDRTIVKIAPSKNVFGFNFYTKLVSMFDGGGDMFGMGEDNPFGNMLPFMLMSEGNSNKDILFAMMCMNNKNLGDNSMMPLLMMSMMGKDNGGDQDFATMMMMSQMTGHKKSIKKEN